MSTSAPAQIELYTNHICPWAHRAHIALSILSLPFTEHIIDLDTPRSAAYLSINPRGLVPTLIYNGEIITESGIVAQFLADQYPGKLQKSSSEEGGALERARTNFFVDAFVTKLVPQIFAGLRAETVEEKAKSAQELVDAVKKELEPLLGNAAPFFGGSSVLTLAEVQTGSFLLRLLTAPKHGFTAPTLLDDLAAQTPNFWKWASEVVKQDAVVGIWDEEEVTEATKRRLAKLKAAAAKV